MNHTKYIYCLSFIFLLFGGVLRAQVAPPNNDTQLKAMKTNRSIAPPPKRHRSTEKVAPPSRDLVLAEAAKRKIAVVQQNQMKSTVEFTSRVQSVLDKVINFDGGYQLYLDFPRMNWSRLLVPEKEYAVSFRETFQGGAIAPQLMVKQDKERVLQVIDSRGERPRSISLGKNVRIYQDLKKKQVRTRTESETYYRIPVYFENRATRTKILLDTGKPVSVKIEGKSYSLTLTGSTETAPNKNGEFCQGPAFELQGIIHQKLR